jgi:WRKY transcription factor 22
VIDYCDFHGVRSSKKSQLKKVVYEVPVADGGVSSDLWAWRKYGQKPIKGSPYPR